jgi:nucleoside-diphosphate-sugar epimerase
MKIFVTGGSGFIGSHFSEHASRAGHEVFVLSRRKNVENASSHLRWVEGDLSIKFDEVPKQMDVFVHMAAHGVHDLHDWDGCFHWNVMESLRLWREAVERGVRKFLIVGSCFEYGRAGERHDFIPTSAALEPTGAYHASKAAATMAAQALANECNLRLCVARPFHIYGDGEAASRFWPSLRAAGLSGKDLPMTSGRQVRDFTPVNEAARQLLREVEGLDMVIPGLPRLVNIGSGRPLTLEAFAREEWRKLDARGKLLLGAIPDRPDEVYRYVPHISP